jgi:hypothetical protein
MSTRRTLLASALLLTACTPEPIQNPNTLPEGLAQRRETALPDGPDIAEQAMGFLLVSDGARLARDLGGSDADLATAVGVDPQLLTVLDLKRPMAVAMLNPTLLASPNVRPYVALLPVKSRDAVMKLLAAHGSVEPTPWGAEWTTSSGKIAIGIDRGYAVVAWRKDLLAGAARMLRPHLAERAEAPLRVHVDVGNLMTNYGKQMEAMVARFELVAAQGGRGREPQLGYALRQVRAMAPYLPSFAGLEVLADLNSGGLTLSVALEGKPGGAWAEYVQQQRPGPAWGVRFLPRDAVLAYTTTVSPMGRARDVQALVEYLGGATSADQDRWRDALERAVGAIGGELAYAVWPARSGGVGMGGAYRLSDPGGAREAISGAYHELEGPLSQLVVRGLRLDPEKYAHRLTVTRARAQVSGMEVDLVEVSVKWPAGAEAQRRTFEAMFGGKLVLATAYAGDEAVFALGADWQERLGTMIQVARGEGAASLGDEPAFVEALSFRDHDRVSFTWLDTSKMARFVGVLTSQMRDLPAAEQARLAQVMAGAGPGAIVSTTNAHGARYQLTTHLPPGAVAGGAQLHGGLWRMALSPLVNPPTMPPMPIP